MEDSAGRRSMGIFDNTAPDNFNCSRSREIVKNLSGRLRVNTSNNTFDACKTSGMKARTDSLAKVDTSAGLQYRQIRSAADKFVFSKLFHFADAFKVCGDVHQAILDCFRVFKTYIRVILRLKSNRDCTEAIGNKGSQVDPRRKPADHTCPLSFRTKRLMNNKH